MLFAVAELLVNGSSAIADITLSSPGNAGEILHLQLITPAKVSKLLPAEVYISGTLQGFRNLSIC